jgi:hypothetical protein
VPNLVLAPLVNLITTGLVAIGVPGAVTAGVASGTAGAIANTLVGVAASVGASLLTRQRFSQPQAEYQIVFNQAKAPRRRGYGRAKLGGPRAFFDSKDGALDQIIMLHHGAIDAIESFWIGDTQVALDEADGSVTTQPWAGDLGDHVFIGSRLGSDDSLAYSEMTSVWGSAWTSEHRLRGIATIWARFDEVGQEDFARLFPDGHNTPVRTICRLARVFDPRDATTAWSDNPALAIRDFLVSPDGFPGIDAGDINDAAFAAFADVCDVMVDTKGGGSEKRYRLSGLYSLQDEPKDSLRRMLASCDGELYEDAAGLICIRGGAYQAPTVLITDADILSFELEQGSELFSAFNALKVTYTEPGQDYQPTETTTWINAADQAARGEIEEELTIDMVPAPGQARRLAKIFERKSNPRWRGTVTTNLAGLNARGERLIRIVIEELAVDETFLVESHGIRADLSGCEMSVISLGAEAYAFDAEADGAAPPPPPDNTSPDPTVEVPAGLALSKAGLVVTATVDAPSRSTLTLQAQIRVKTPPGPWREMTSAQGELTAESGTLTAAVAYQVRARWSVNQAVSAWTSIVEITV